MLHVERHAHTAHAAEIVGVRGQTIPLVQINRVSESRRIETSGVFKVFTYLSSYLMIMRGFKTIRVMY